MRTKKGEPLPVLIAEVNSAIQSTTLRQLSNDADAGMPEN